MHCLESGSSEFIFKVAAAVITNGSKLLVTRRIKPTELAGLWEFPGGKVKVGESLSQCLVREIREELSLSIEVKELLGTFVHCTDRGAIEINFFHASITDGILELHDHSDYSWADPEKLAGYEFAPADRRFVDCLLKGEISLDQPFSRQQRK